jgi:hypothetical protein
LEQLLTLPRIGGLAILSRDVTLGAIKTLRRLPDLRELILCGPPIRDDFLEGLEVLPQLERLTLVHSSCTPSGVQMFQKFAPQCAVYKAGVDGVLPASLRRDLTPFL